MVSYIIYLLFTISIAELAYISDIERKHIILQTTIYFICSIMFEFQQLNLAPSVKCKQIRNL